LVERSASQINGCSVSDDTWNEAARHYNDHALASLLVAITAIKAWNRLNVATRQIPFGKLPEAAVPA